MQGRHKTRKSVNSPTYSKDWSGVSYAPHCEKAKCPNCGGHLHHEAGSHYCPYCDDYVSAYPECKYN